MHNLKLHFIFCYSNAFSVFQQTTFPSKNAGKIYTYKIYTPKSRVVKRVSRNKINIPFSEPVTQSVNNLLLKTTTKKQAKS